MLVLAVRVFHFFFEQQIAYIILRIPCLVYVL